MFSQSGSTMLCFCAVGGSVGSGKSSLVAVLTHGVDGEPLLDDGRGRARTAVFRHKHEIQSGHTSSISQSMLGYDSSGNVLNYLGVSSLTATEISAAAQKVLHFIDLTGHSRFLRTALYGALPVLLVLWLSFERRACSQVVDSYASMSWQPHNMICISSCAGGCDIT